MGYQRQWDGTAWQEYSLRLAQQRHGAVNVQQVPDAVRGDCGIEFFALDGCLYQCYAPEEVHDIGKAASGQKNKAYRDLKKLEKNGEAIAEILQDLKVQRWILLCPVLDDKDVVAYVRSRGKKLREAKLPFLDSSFEAVVQSQSDFEKEIQLLRLRSLGNPVTLTLPTTLDVDSSSSGEQGQRLREKLERAFPNWPATRREERARAHIHNLLTRDNVLEEMRVNQAVLWEKTIQCLQAEEGRLGALGGGDCEPTALLIDSAARIETSLKHDLSGFPASVTTVMSTGTVADWLVRCPLDFPQGDGA